MKRRTGKVSIMSRRKQPRGQACRILGALSMPLVALIVIAVVGFGVNRVREESHAISHPPSTRPIPATVVQINSRDVAYEVFGDLGDSGKVSYTNSSETAASSLAVA